MEEKGTVKYDVFENPEWKTAQIVQFLDVDDLFRVLDSDLIENTEDEKFVRIRIWWTFNDRMRNDKTYHFEEADEQRWNSNIKKLIPLLDSSKDNQAIMLAELHRNLGDFDRCMEILKTVDDDEFSNTLGTIRANCFKENRWVVRIQFA